jgi:lipopolysaccharide export system permease protein
MSQFAPFGTLFRYFAMRFVAWITLCLFGLAAIISLIQTVELVRRVSVLNNTKPNVNFLNLAILNLPAVIEMILPFAMLTGAMLCFSSWNRSNEFVAVRGFGQSVWAALGPALFSAFLFGMLFVTVINPIGAVTSTRHEAQMAKIFGEADKSFSVSADGVWLRDKIKDGKLIIRGDALNTEMASIINPIIYFYENNIRLKALYRANVMQLTDKGWMLDQATRWHNDGRQTDLGNIILPTGIEALDLRQSGLLPQSISIYLLPSFISSLERAGIPATEYRFHLYKMLSTPLLMVGIAMLAARITLTNTSRGRKSRLFLRGALLSIIIFIFSYFMQVLGSSLRIPMSVAAWTPAIVVSLLGAIILARADES